MRRPKSQLIADLSAYLEQMPPGEFRSVRFLADYFDTTKSRINAMILNDPALFEIVSSRRCVSVTSYLVPLWYENLPHPTDWPVETAQAEQLRLDLPTGTALQPFLDGEDKDADVVIFQGHTSTLRLAVTTKRARQTINDAEVWVGDIVTDRNELAAVSKGQGCEIQALETKVRDLTREVDRLKSLLINTQARLLSVVTASHPLPEDVTDTVQSKIVNFR